MKTALKVLFFSCLTILCLFIIEKNKQIKQYKIQEQHQLNLLDTLQLELDSLNLEIDETHKKSPYRFTSWSRCYLTTTFICIY